MSSTRGSLVRVLLTCVLAAGGGAVSQGKDLGGYVHRTEVAPYTFDDSILRLRLDFAKGIVYGDETVLVRPKRLLTVIPFDSHRLVYQRVSVDGRSAAFVLDEVHDRINVQLPSPARAGTRLRIEFRYSVQPQCGVYFIRPDKAHPKLIPEIWTQGEPTDNRCWFPTWDEPNDKTPSELIVTVPHGWTVVGNGLLRAHTHDASSDTWDWNAPLPKSTYLIAFAAGPFQEVPDTLGNLAVDGFVAPGLAKAGSLCFRNTPAMIAYYERITGVPYPFEKYDQIAVERDMFGGMEDASNTIVTDRALHPPSENVERSCDLLVSHELAQQWYGDDATTVDWSNIWLNEGFATYYDELWTGERFGTAAFEYARYLAQQKYFAETDRYMRPIVDYKYRDPLQLFDASGHERPAQALHMLRWMVGDARFFRAVDAYLRTYAYRNADTHQFFAAIDKSLGTDLTWFENEWFYRASYPNYHVSDRYDSARHVLLLHVEQQNPDGRPFRMPIVIQAFVGQNVISREVTIDRVEQDVALSNVSASPQMVLFDPDDEVLKKLVWAKTAPQLAYQLANAAHVGDREWALQQLAEFCSARGADRSLAVTAVARSVTSDPFWGLRADAVATVASCDDASAVGAALHDVDPRVRIAAEGATGRLKGKPATIVHELETMTSDPDPDIASGAAAALGNLPASVR